MQENGLLNIRKGTAGLGHRPERHDMSVITLIDVAMFTLFDGVSGSAEWEDGDRPPYWSWY
jgi:hypothetical protein